MNSPGTLFATCLYSREWRNISFKDKFINMPDETCDLFCKPQEQGSTKMTASNVIFLVLQVVVATDHRIHLNKLVQEVEWTRLPVRMIDMPCS